MLTEGIAHPTLGFHDLTVPGSAQLVISPVLGSLRQGSKDQGQHIRMLLGILLHITQETLHLAFCTLVGQMRERARLSSVLKSVDIEQGLLRILWE